MLPKNMKLENAVFYTADGRKIGRIEEIDSISDPFDLNEGTTIIQDDEFGFTYEVDVIQTLRKNGFTKITHKALYSKRWRIRKKYVDLCWELLEFIVRYL